MGAKELHILQVNSVYEVNAQILNSSFINWLLLRIPDQALITSVRRLSPELNLLILLNTDILKTCSLLALLLLRLQPYILKSPYLN